MSSDTEIPVSARRSAAPVWLFCLALNLAAPAWAQDMRVYTTVTDASHGNGQSRVISHSLTLFHAGKVYDYMEEVGEVVIYEPIHHRFVILGKDYAATEVPFSELNHYLEIAETESRRYLDQLSANNAGESGRSAELIRFQLDPQFEEELDPARNRLDLKGGCLDYSVTTAKIEQEQFVRQYLDYADWAARLNFVLHPNAAFPEARLTLNRSLREKQLLPTQVELTLQLADPVRLRADHSFRWEFQSVDRRHISHWEKMLRSNDVRWMSFQEYQQQLVANRGR
jgi:hypothetical protein